MLPLAAGPTDQISCDYLYGGNESEVLMTLLVLGEASCVTSVQPCCRFQTDKKLLAPGRSRRSQGETPDLYTS